MIFNIEKYTGEPHRKGQRLFLLIILGLAILYSGAFSYVNWNPTYGGWVSQVVSIAFVAYLLLSWPKGSKYNFKTDVLLLTFLPFLSSISTNIYYGQSFYDSIRALTGNFVWVFYFVLQKYKVQEATVLKAFLVIALFIVGVQIIQQFTYPNALFGVSTIEEAVEKGNLEVAEQRNGLWRFRMHANSYFTAPVLFAALMWARKKINPQLVFIIAAMLVSVYLTLTRQVIASCLLSIFLSFFLGKKSKGMARVLIIGVILFAILYAYSDVLFGSLAEQTSDDMTDSNIRLLAAAYYWDESVSNPLAFVFGFGLPSHNGAFARLINYQKETLKFFTTDVGAIGKIYEYGIIYVILCYYLLWKVLFKLKKVVPLYIRVFTIFVGVMSIMIFPFATTLYYFIWTCLLHICDIYINRAKALAKAEKAKLNNESKQ